MFLICKIKHIKDIYKTILYYYLVDVCKRIKITLTWSYSGNMALYYLDSNDQFLQDTYVM